MAIDTTVFAADLGSMIADLPATATAAFLSGSVSVSVAELGTEATLIIAGNLDKRVFACTLPATATTAVPKVQQRIAIRRPGEAAATNYQIQKVAAPADGVAFTLFVIQDSRHP